MYKYLLLSVLLIILTFNAKAEYIKFGGGVGKTGNISTFDLNALSIGVYSFLDWDYQERMTLGISLQEQIAGIQDVYKSIQLPTTASISQRINPVLNSTSFTSILVTLDFDLFAEGGLYMFTGIGYGLDLRVKKSAGDLVKIADQLTNIDNIEELLNNQEFKDNLLNLANSDILYNLINTILPNSDLSSQVDSYEKILNLVNNSNDLENFLNQFDNDYNAQYHGSFSTDKIQGGAVSLVCKTAINCDSGVAYQLGLGYEVPIFSIMKLDLYTKMSGLIGNIPYYSAGFNIMFKY